MHFIGRRNFLAGLGLGAGAHLLGAFWKSTVPEAMGAELARKRLILFTAANGFLERFYNCPARSETDFDLAPVYQPVAAHKSKMVVAQQVLQPVQQGAARQPARDPDGDGEHQPQRLAEARAARGHLHRPADRQEDRGGGRVLVHRLRPGHQRQRRRRGAVGAAHQQPQQGVRHLLRRRLPHTAAGRGHARANLETFQSDFEQDKSFLDLLRADVSRMNARLAAPERAKLEQYLESLRNLEVQIGKRATAQTGCTKPGKPADGGVLDQQLIAHIDIVFAAQKCGLTHVSHIAFEGMEGPHIIYSWLEDPRNHHDDHHASDMPILQKIDTWWFERIGQMLDHLASTPEGNGTMLDNSLVMFLNTCGGSHHRGYDNHPM